MRNIFDDTYKLIQETIIESKKNNTSKEINDLILNYPVEKIVNVLESLEIKTIVFFFNSIEKIKWADWFNYLSEEIQESLLENLENKKIINIIEDLESDELIDLIERIPTELSDKIRGLISQDTRISVNKLLSYNDEEAGSIMNINFFSLQMNWTIKKSLEEIKNNINKFENFNAYYIVDEKNKLVGKVTLEQLVFQSSYRKILSNVMDTNITYCDAKENIETVTRIFEKYNKEAIPIVSSEMELLGIISDNDIVDYIIEDATDDINRLNAIGDMKKSYSQTSVFEIFKSRIFWLTILMIAATFTTLVIDKFQIWGQGLTGGISTILLIPIIPVITGTSGNAGSQSAASVIRSLSIGEITPKEYKRVVWKEIKAAFIIGLFLAVINILRLSIYYLIISPDNSISEQGEYYKEIVSNYGIYGFSMIVGLASSLALWIAVILSKIIGTCLPIIAIKIKVDPTVMSGPLIATLLDTISMTIFFTVGIMVITNLI
jgi:magnesium transporter